MADMRKQLSKLKVVELKEKLQELGKTPKGLKADLVNQLAEAYEEQNKGMADQSAPLQAYQTSAPMADPMLTAESPESQYYQQPVGQYQMPAQEVYDQTQNYLQPPYEQQYPYQTHPQVFSPTHEQQYNQSPAQYPMSSQLSPRIAPQMSPQLSPQMTGQLAPPIQQQMSQQLSPQMATQQFRPAEFQSPHRGFQSNESEYNDYGGQTAPEQMAHFGMPHMDIHAMPTTQAAIPPSHSSHPSTQLHTPPVIENYGSELSQNQSLDQNIAPDMNAYKQEEEAFIPPHPSMVTPQQQMVATEAPTDIIDFDDVSIGIDAANEVQYNQQLAPFETDQSQSEFDINEPTDPQFPRDVNDGQTFSQTNQLPEMAANDETNDTNVTNESTDVDSNDSNQSSSTDGDVKQIENNFDGERVADEPSFPSSESSLNISPNMTNVGQNDPLIKQTVSSDEPSNEMKRIEETSMESVQTNDDSVNDDNRDEEYKDRTNDVSDKNTLEAIDEMHDKSDSEIAEQNVEIKEQSTESDQKLEREDTQTLNDKDDKEEPEDNDEVISKPESEPEAQESSSSEQERSVSSMSPRQKSIPSESISQEPLSSKPIDSEPIPLKPIDSETIPSKSTASEPIPPKILVPEAMPSKSLASETTTSEPEASKPMPSATPTERKLSTTIEIAVDDVKPEEPVVSIQNGTSAVNGDQDDTSKNQNGLDDNKKLTKNQKKKQRKKARAMRRQLEEQKQSKAHSQPKQEDDDKMDIDDEDDPEKEVVEIEYVPETLKEKEKGLPIYFQYLKVFEKFRTGESKPELEDIYIDPHRKLMERKKPVELDLKDDEEKKDGEQKISKRKMKQLTRMSIAELKQRVNHPELVEMHDVTAKDPLLLLHLKATRNSVPVPRHWCYKRKYLQGKRGFEKPPFKLPEFIRRTGIMEMRQALQEKEESKSLKAQMREKIRPKMGKIDIDYQKLHDAFFKWQTKPRMTIHGDLYYEGKEFETRLKEKRPGDLSTELRTALGMPTGPNAHKCPPPWLIAMQRYGPPPSYPNLKIPGLNAPIPDSCSFGYHAGGWGKPPVDEYGRPLYGDVFGTTATTSHHVVEEEVDRTLWGDMEDESEEEESSEEEEEETDVPSAPGKAPAKEVDETGFVTPAEGLVTPSGLTSIPTGLETPDLIELRKRKQIEAEMESGDNPALYTVIPEKKGDKIGREMMGSAHTYDMSAATLRKGHGVDVALDPSDLEAGALDSAQMAARYEQTMKEQSSHLSKGEDLSDMVAEHAARQKRKKQQDTSKSAKKYQFKF